MILGSSQILINTELMVWSIMTLENPFHMVSQGLILGTRVMTGFSWTAKVSLISNIERLQNNMEMVS
jgi:hypothetical protein